MQIMPNLQNSREHKLFIKTSTHVLKQNTEQRMTFEWGESYIPTWASAAPKRHRLKAKILMNHIYCLEEIEKRQ